MLRSVQCQELEDSSREAQEETSSTVAELRQVIHPGCKHQFAERYAGICNFAVDPIAAFWHTSEWHAQSYVCCHIAQLDTDSLSAPNLGLAE